MTRGPKPRPIQIPLLERPRLLELAAKQRTAHVLVQRAKMILLLAEGLVASRRAGWAGAGGENWACQTGIGQS